MASTDSSATTTTTTTTTSSTTLPYSWTQTLPEVSVSVPIPPNIRSKDLNVVVKQLHLEVGIKGQKPIVSGNLHKPVKHGDAIWSIGVLLFLSLFFFSFVMVV
jgi:hypothetical protein